MSSISNVSHAALAVLFALGGSALAEGCCFTPSPAPAPTSVTVPSVVPATPTPAAGGGGVCGRASECCTAYCDAITNAQGNVTAQAMAGSIGQVRAICGTYASMGAQPGTEAGCQSAMDGYRTGLTAMGVDVPAACQ
ncbi:MAG: hypothetical protein J0L92_39845 [Deltaproteobacteria bacterium]|nr:hypothetical protein [Deltaproteobacteria bacterium]